MVLSASDMATSTHRHLLIEFPPTRMRENINNEIIYVHYGKNEVRG
jgi:hypothetical protein